jgi:hypothetical protein
MSGGAEAPSTRPSHTESILLGDAVAWHAVLHHPFLFACHDGTIKPAQFNRWLVQDYLFVTHFTRLAANLLVSAPVEHFDLILSGLAALQDELSWFKVHTSASHVAGKDMCVGFFVCRLSDVLGPLCAGEGAGEGVAAGRPASPDMCRVRQHDGGAQG